MRRKNLFARTCALAVVMMFLLVPIGTTDTARWRNGDFDLDGDVDRDDFHAVMVNFGYKSAGHPVMLPPIAPATDAGAPDGVAPEPAVMGILAVGALALLRRRPRRRQ